MERFDKDIEKIQSELDNQFYSKSSEISDLLSMAQDDNVSEENKKEYLDYAERVLDSFEEILSKLLGFYLQMIGSGFEDFLKQIRYKYTQEVSSRRNKLDMLKGYNELATDEIGNENDRNYNNFEDLLYDRWIELNKTIEINLNVEESFDTNGYKFDKMLMVLSLLDERVGINKENTQIVKFNNFYLILFKDFSKTLIVSNDFGKPTYIIEEEIYFTELRKYSLNDILGFRGGAIIRDYDGDTIENFENKLLNTNLIPSGDMVYDIQSMEEAFPEIAKSNNKEANTKEEKFLKHIKYLYLTGAITDKQLDDEELWLDCVNSMSFNEELPFNTWEEFRKYLEGSEQINNYWSTVQLLFSLGFDK